MASTEMATPSGMKPIEEMETVVIRFCGDSGDGMQLAGTQFTNVSAAFGNDVSTLPDFPAEIRAPAGSLSGVSGFQISFSSKDIFTPGDEVDTLVAMNPAALKTNLADLKRGGTLIVNEDAFDKSNLTKASYDSNPLDDEESLAGYRLFKVPMTRLTKDALSELDISQREAVRCKNFFALGLVYWLYNRDSKPTVDWVNKKFSKLPIVAEANIRALKGGRNYGDSTEAFTVHYKVSKADLPPGKYRKITGNEALAMGLATIAKLSNKTLIYSGYPITPASDILHELSKLKNFNVKTFQAEDEIAAMSAAVGAAFGGELSVTASSGPGICLKGEAMGLGAITELPMVIIDVQRGGPSTGLPTKTEQSDLLLAMFGRNGESPLPIIAPATPGDCFEMAQQAMRIAVEHMTPVILLSDGYIANGAEPWQIPDVSDLTPIKINHPTELNEDGIYEPYARDENLTRPWAIPGTTGLEHRVGGLEKSNISGNVSYDPENHHDMTLLRAKKVKLIANRLPAQEVLGPKTGDLLVVSWGGTYGSVRTAVSHAIEEGKSVAHAHIRYLNPFPNNLGEILKKYDQILIPELNMGQLRLLLRSEFLVDAQGLNKIKGKPFLISEISEKINAMLAG
ncbi:2-oxoglutarate oxidoreductase subunit KorA [Polystyrenella longa]|uniref:2-oxoglutarate oxidoreductase subunit KorA n=1 Tax=Polystyrenella longa TaxID=2528007 RepID=A0A518CNK8_9PLAN|nr:2-oxoacid:acceptor oxidoreductase subunit alpha [Polystyrenella longa]QDU80810.1 2-oxoglutarate oxidoreductase subunit KorA [Polystyrenella longa]